VSDVLRIDLDLTRISVDELCRRFAESPDMFIRGVTPEDARRLYDYGVESGMGGVAVMEMALWGRRTPDEAIDALRRYSAV
jgi:thiamine monophosphate synthase